MADGGMNNTRSATVAFAPSPSERERTAQESSVSLRDPNEPTTRPWRLNAALKMRENRLGDIPGWADQLNAGYGAAREGCIALLTNDHDHAVQRRRLWARVTLHVAFQTALFAACVFVPPVATVLETVFEPFWTRLVLFASLPVALVVLKLVLDATVLRVLVFLLHSVGVVVLFASTQLVLNMPTISHCFALVLVMCIVVLLLCGVQVTTRPRTSATGNVASSTTSAAATTALLGDKIMGLLTLLVTFGASLLVHFLVPGPSLYTEDMLGAWQSFALALVSVAMPFEFHALCRSLTPRDAWLGVYLVQFDLLVALLVAPLAFLSFAVGLVAAGLYVGTCGVLSTLWALFTNVFGCVIDCHLAPRRRARVDVLAAAETSATLTTGAPNGSLDPSGSSRR